MRARAVDDVCFTGRENAQLIVITIIHMGQKRGEVDQPEACGKANRAAGKIRNFVIPLADGFPQLSKRSGVIFQEISFIRRFGQMGRERQMIFFGRQTAGGVGERFHGVGGVG